MSSSADSQAQTIAELTCRIQEFASARDWAQFHNSKNLTMSLASETGELAAIFRWIDGRDSDASVAAGPRRDQLEAEIGDIGICLLLLCARVDVDLGSAVTRKLAANAIKYPIETSRGRADPPEPI